MLNSIRTGPRGGVPVVLLHPVSLDLTYWTPQIEVLRATHDVIAYDYPGHGRTPGGPRDWSFDQAAALLAGVIRDSGAGSAHLVGLSVGGMIAQALAIAQPALVASLSLIGTAATFAEPVRAIIRARAEATRDGGMASILRPTLDRWFAPETLAGRPELIDRVTKTFLANDPAVHAAMWDMVAALDFAADLPRISVPTLVLTGELDPNTPPASARFIADGIAGAEMHVIPGASHMVTLEQPAAINDRLRHFLAGSHEPTG